MKKTLYSVAAVFFIITLSAQNITVVINSKGPALGYAKESGVKILNIEGRQFKDLNRNGKLDIYEDWRLSAEERAKDLSSKMTIEQIAGLMLYSRHQSVPAGNDGFRAGTYNGRVFSESGASPWDLTDEQKKFLRKDNLRHVLVTTVQSPEVAAKWNNKLQAYVEGLGLGIPANNSSDPRHAASVTAEFNEGAGGQISLWPDGLAMGATFDPELVREFGRVAAEEYRALGITTALSPQIDLGTEPRWYRIAYVFSESPALTTDMARAYIDGFQTSTGKNAPANGWGNKSVNAMVKHWPGGGPGEGGRDAHWAMGKFAVYPGNNFQEHLKPFTQGAFRLDGGTKQAAAVMPYYTISYNQDIKNKENVGNGFSKYLITDLLREKYAYDGVVCTDWLITADEGKTPGDFAGKPWGVEKMSVAERHYKALEAGVDQFGGNNDMEPILEAYQTGIKKYGEKQMRKRFEQSAVRLLKNIFRVGLFENPYVDADYAKETVGNPEFMKAGYQAQVKSVVMLKNKSAILPVKERKAVYIPKRYNPETFNWWGNYKASTLDYPVSLEMVKKYYNVTDDPAKADFAIVFVQSPHSEEAGYSDTDVKEGGNGYLPVSLQYKTYTATDARERSIAAGDPVIAPNIKDRTYKNKSTTASNFTDLLMIQNTYKAMKGKPVIVSVTVSKPMIFSEFERQANAILVNFNVSTKAVLDIISGTYEPSGLLPVQMPADMKTVEEQKEDIPYDMTPYTDSERHTYDFGFGLNWSGVIKDKRTEKYKK
ncbi:glycoside hydrolase family 3 C-terminal domain-containing protein [Elizabethkingia anophelis]|uniref:glycoside hydrolase family 3 protein n=1 Tax=Elizabethkingia anophelis TaxID=1117645 RepID=UPI0021A89E83|nr:glycoside hydrolase family 3 C-terminal domain-containing protein [Elizabethkingia anophelis]MCT3975604.1 glycoside hydrolase family 3 C-terminal domain-containing protein [Elizabethkingia anophelis]MCT4039404.1 glycoside hydrolase family 3 C-terminal domain-containing protein [Elizabethkingia anophelis]MDV3866062.1 beta-glucosidase [Elizabethkingia anophelis]